MKNTTSTNAIAPRGLRRAASPNPDHRDRPSRIGGARTPSMATSLCITHPWVQPGVGYVDCQIDQQEDRRDKQDVRLYLGVVAVVDGAEGREPKARQHE